MKQAVKREPGSRASAWAATSRSSPVIAARDRAQEDRTQGSCGDNRDLPESRACWDRPVRASSRQVLNSSKPSGWRQRWSSTAPPATRDQRLSRDQLATLISGLGNLLDVLTTAAPEDKAEVYARARAPSRLRPGSTGSHRRITASTSAPAATSTETGGATYVSERGLRP